MSAISEQSAWLLRSRFSPFPVSGELELEAGRISFTLDAAAAEARLDWLEEELGAGALKDRLEAGERVVAFSHPLEDCTISWPLTGGAQMVVAAPDRRWIISHDPPHAGRIPQALNLFSARRRAREWKQALAEAGASYRRYYSCQRKPVGDGAGSSGLSGRPSGTLGSL